MEQKTINGGDDDDDDDDDDASVLLSSVAKDEKKLKLLCNGASTGIGGFVTQLAAQVSHKCSVLLRYFNALFFYITLHTNARKPF